MPNTHGAIDLTGGHEHSPEPTPGFDELSEQDKADLAALAQDTGTQPAPTGQPVEAMFLVIIPHHGHAVGIRDVSQAANFYGRPATIEEMAYASRVVADEINMNKQAQILAMQQMQAAAAMQQQMEHARVAAELAGTPGFPSNGQSASPFRRQR